MKKLVLFIIVCLFFFQGIEAQRNISGVITDINGNKLSNVIIAVKGTNFNTFSASNGSYIITVPTNNNALIFSLPKYISLEIDITKNVLDIRMIKDNKELISFSLAELAQLVICTAGKKSEKINTIPASVELITKADIASYGYTSLEEIIANITGYYTIDDLSYTLSLPGVRGVLSQNGTGVIILINGVNQLRKGLESYSLRESNVPVESIDRIEIIKGPMSVMYGTGAFFGVINIITDKPEAGNLQGHVTASTGSLKTKKTSISVTGKGGNVNYSMNAGYAYTYGRNFNLSEMTDDFTQFATVNAPQNTDGRLEGTDKYFDMSVDLKPFYCKVTYMEIMQEAYGVSANWDDKGGHHENSRMNMMTGFNKSITDKLNVNASLRYTILNEWIDIAWLRQDYYGKQDLRANSYDTELRVNYSPTNKIDVTMGANHNALLNYFMIWDYTAVGSFYNNHLRQLDPKNNINNTSLFFQANYAPYNKLKVIGGLRIEKLSDYDFLQSFGSDTTGNNSNAMRTTLYGNYKSEGVSIVPRAALLYQFNKSNTLKFFYGEAIRHPTIDENSQNIKDIDKYGNLESERIKTYELNYTTTILSKLNINVSLYHNQLKNLISRLWETNSKGNVVSHQENAGTYKTNGVELSVLATPAQNLKLKLSGSYQKTEDKRMGFKSVTVAYSPNLLVHAGIFYKIEKYSISIFGNYVDAMEAPWTGLAPNEANAGGRIGQGSDAYFTLNGNLRASKLFGTGIFINLKASNLLNQKYTIPASSLHTWAEKGNPGYGRMFLFSLGTRF